MTTLNSQLELSRCPHCQVNTPNLSIKHELRTLSAAGVDRYWGVYACGRCGGVVTACAPRNTKTIEDYFPKQREIAESIPEPARSYLSQAYDSLHAPAGSIMLSASAVDAMLKENKYVEGTLYARIEQAAKDHLITNGMKEWAHKVRLDANIQRHADQNSGLPDDKDAQHTFEFAVALAEFLFVLPAKVKSGIEEAEPEGIPTAIASDSP